MDYNRQYNINKVSRKNEKKLLKDPYNAMEKPEYKN